MMKRNIFVAMTLMVMMAVATPAGAQFGNLIKEVKVKAKNKVHQAETNIRNKAEQKANQGKNAVINKAEDAVEGAVGKAVEKTGLPVSYGKKKSGNSKTNLTTLYKKKYKPSAAAIAAFPNAGSNEVWNRASRPFSQIYGAYEHLDPEYFPLQPYYKYPMMYGLGMKAVVGMNVLSDMIRTRLGNGFGSVTTFLPFVYNESDNTELLTPNGEKMGVYRDDVFRYPYAAAFFADPNSDIAVYNLAELLAYLSPTINSGVNIEADDDANGILDSKNGVVLPASHYKSLRAERERLMLEMACEVVDMELIADRVVQSFEKVEENDAFCQKDPSLRTKYLLMGTELYSRILVNHKDWKKKKDSSAKARRATMLFTRYDQTPEALAIINNVRSANVPAVAMPKGVSVSASVKAKGDAAGRVLAGHRGDEFVKVVYLSKSWSTFKQPKWPYKVMHYSIPVDLITKADGKTVLTHCELHKSSDGSKYVMVVGKDAEKHPVK